MLHCSASELIREQKGRITWDAAKHVKEIDDNQQALVAALNRKREQGRDLLLDGHFVLRNEIGSIAPIDTGAFVMLRLAGVVLLEEDAEVVVGRLHARDGQQVTTIDVLEMARAERETAQRVTSELGLPLHTLVRPTAASLLSTVRQLLAGRVAKQ